MSVLNLEHKDLPVAGVNVVSETKGIVETIVSVTGIVDEVKDVIEPGAFERTLAKRTTRDIWSHNWNEAISKTLAITELDPASGIPSTIW